jgi:hypothetical protein
MQASSSPKELVLFYVIEQKKVKNKFWYCPLKRGSNEFSRKIRSVSGY